MHGGACRGGTLEAWWRRFGAHDGGVLEVQFGGAWWSLSWRHFRGLVEAFWGCSLEVGKVVSWWFYGDTRFCSGATMHSALRYSFFLTLDGLATLFF